MKKRFISTFEYLFVFMGFSLMLFFIIPNSDVFFFTKDYENSLPILIENSLKYGNGRLFGNLIGFLFAHNFLYSFILIALSLTVLVFLINRLLFNGNVYTAFPVALLIAIPSTGMFSEVYYQLPTAINYVIPIVLAFSSLCLIKFANKSKIKHLYGILIFIVTAFACLFSENTTISIFTLSVLFFLFCVFYKKESFAPGLYFLSGSIIGGLIMILLPKLTNSSNNLDYYRGTAKTLTSMITLAISSFSTFADIFSKFCVPIIITSICLIILLNKTSKKKQFLKNIVTFYLVFFCIESILYALLSQNAPATVYLYIPQLALVVLYALSIIVAILMLEKNQFRTILIGLFILMLSSVGPMLFVDKYSYRTYYLSYVIFLSFSLLLFKSIIPIIKESFANRVLKEKSLKMIASASCVVFACISLIVFFQSIYNYNFYVARTQLIAQQSAQGVEEICVPFLPCRSISNEEENPTLVSTIQYKKGHSSEIKITESIYCDNNEDYYNILNTNPLSNLVSAIQNIKYKDPNFFNPLLENNKVLTK